MHFTTAWVLKLWKGSGRGSDAEWFRSSGWLPLDKWAEASCMPSMQVPGSLLDVAEAGCAPRLPAAFTKGIKCIWMQDMLTTSFRSLSPE